MMETLIITFNSLSLFERSLFLCVYGCVCRDVHVYNLMWWINVNAIINIALTYVNKNSRKICPNNVWILVWSKWRNVAMRSNQLDMDGKSVGKSSGNRCIILASCLHLKFIHATTLSPERHSDERHEIHLRGRCCLAGKTTCSPFRWWNARQKLSMVAMVYCHCFYSSPVCNCQRAKPSYQSCMYATKWYYDQQRHTI